MPKVTIWIREADYPKWEAIDDKPDWINRRLNDDKMIFIDPSQIRSTRLKLDKRMIMTDDTTITGDSLKQTVTIDNGKERQTLSTKPGMFDRPAQKFCKHDMPLGMCKKGCK